MHTLKILQFLVVMLAQAMNITLFWSRYYVSLLRLHCDMVIITGLQSMRRAAKGERLPLVRYFTGDLSRQREVFFLHQGKGL